MKMVLEALSIALNLAALVLIIWHILPNAGVNLKKCIDINREREGCIPGKKECLKLFLYLILFRFFILIVGFVIHCIFVEKGNVFNYNNIYDAWLKWDANNYIRIANGYRSFPINGEYTIIVFFPLYSWLLKIVNLLITDVNAAGLFTSAVCSSLALVYFYKLVSLDYGKEIAKKAVVLTLIFPFGFFYGAIMSESAFLLTSVLTLYYGRKHKWLLAGVYGFFAALSRSVGVFLIIPLTVEFIEEYKLFENFKSKLILIVKKWAALLLIPVGTVVYLMINYYVGGDPFYFLRMEKGIWHQTAQPFYKTIETVVGIISGGYSVSTKMASFIPGLVILFFFYIIMLYGARRHRSMYSVWLFVYMMVCTAMSWPLSICRYLMCGIPAYIILADYAEDNDKFYHATVIGFSILFGVFFTGYLMAKQIM